MIRSDDIDKGAKRTEHENRFDRQLRLWGAHGQQLIESTHICALGCGPAVAETLKNLVLPNISMVTIIEDGKVTEEDTGNNFFVAEEDIGKPKGQAVLDKLLEMNPWDEKENFGVKGFFINKNTDKMIEGDVKAFGKYDIIVASDISEANALKLSAFCYESNITFVLIRVNGLVGYVRWTKAEHCISESHPVNVDTSDIRLYPSQLKNFPELEKYLRDFDFKKLRQDEYKHRHIPWPVVVYHQLQDWIKVKGAPPKNFDERSEFKEHIKKQSLSYRVETNFQEASKNAYKACIKPSVSEDVQAVIDDEKAKTLTKDAKPFWIVMYAINEFRKAEGKGDLPVTSAIPDMTALPEMYIKLKNIYNARERKDLEAVRKHVQRALAKLGRDPTSISTEYIDRVAKHIRTAALIRCSPLDTEYDSKKADSEELNEIFEEWEEPIEWDEEEMGGPPPLKPKNIYWYFAMRATERFRTKFGRYPGSPLGADLAGDLKSLVDIQTSMFQEYKIRSKVIPEVLKEVIRFGGKEVHNVASMVGGVASQLCLKLIVKQFTPFDNTFMYNGIHSSANVYRL